MKPYQPSRRSGAHLIATFGAPCALILCLSSCHLLSSPERDEEAEALKPQVTAPSTPSSTPSSAEAVIAGEERPAQEASEAPPPSGQLIARVNGEGVPIEAFNAEYEDRVRTYRARKREVPPRLERTYKLSVMNQLINDRLVWQALKRARVSLTEDELTLALSTYKSRFRSEKNFQSYLKQSNKSQGEILEKVRFNASLEKLISQESPIEVSAEELFGAYEEQKLSRYTSPAKIRVSHILLAVPQNAPKRAVVKAKRAAIKLMKLAKKEGADFEALAKEHSQDPKTKSRGGDLGLLVRKGEVQFSEEFERVAATLPLQTPSEPILSELGWHILKVTDRQAEQLKVSQILLKGPEAAKKAQALLKRAYSEPFSELARSSSQDEASRVRGGDIDFLHPKSPHRFGEEFKRGVFALKRGELGVITGAQGTHVVLITDSRPTRVRVSHILLSFPFDATEAQKAALKAEAIALSDELKIEMSKDKQRSSAFTRAARRRSDDKSSHLRGGDLGPFYIGGEPLFSREVEALMFSLEPGQVSEAVRSPLGWHIFKLTQRTPQHTQSFTEARAELSEQLTSKKLRRQKALFMQRLKSEAKIERYLNLD